MSRYPIRIARLGWRPAMLALLLALFAGDSVIGLRSHGHERFFVGRILDELEQRAHRDTFERVQ